MTSLHPSCSSESKPQKLRGLKTTRGQNAVARRQQHDGKLPININHLLRQRAIEGERIEYKAGWNPQRVLHTICAFANDFHNLGGGYIVLGVEERDGLPVLPPKGISSRFHRCDPEGTAESRQFGHTALLPPAYGDLRN